VKDGKVEDATRQPEQIRAFRDTWKLGIHSYLAYLRDRLTVARELLTETGSIFVQIGDENVHLVRSVMDEVFGSENFIAQIAFSKTTGSTGDFLPGGLDHLLYYTKHRDQAKFRQPFNEKTLETESGGPYSMLEEQDGRRRRMTPGERSRSEQLPGNSRVFRIDNLQPKHGAREGRGRVVLVPCRV
jgi:adenine-specific DNA-methyltransferase